MICDGCHTNRLGVIEWEQVLLTLRSLGFQVSAADRQRGEILAVLYLDQGIYYSEPFGSRFSCSVQFSRTSIRTVRRYFIRC